MTHANEREQTRKYAHGEVWWMRQRGGGRGRWGYGQRDPEMVRFRDSGGEPLMWGAKENLEWAT